jgi:hypothetical protein
MIKFQNLSALPFGRMSEAKFARRLFGSFGFWSDGRRQNLCDELLEQRRSREIQPEGEARSTRICRITMKIATGIRAGVTDQNILRETIFVWMHFFLASRANIRILHNANSRQTRTKEREGRCMEDATIN